MPYIFGDYSSDPITVLNYFSRAHFDFLCVALNWPVLDVLTGFLVYIRILCFLKSRIFLKFEKYEFEFF
jgi:hypothetical protein